MHIYVINLDRSKGRMEEFQRINSHMPNIQRFSAVDGSVVDWQEMMDANAISPELSYTSGALGCAMSHIFFWEAAVAQTSDITVCEDDAIFHPAFPELAPKLISALPADWDLVLWGWNFDSILYFDLLPGVTPCVAQFNQDGLRAGVEEFRTSPVAPQLFRLLRAFGTVCYTISERGAHRLLEACLPLRPLTVSFPLVSSAFPNNGIDIAMNSQYPQLSAYVSLPPLVVTRNDHACSTVLEQ